MDRKQQMKQIARYAVIKNALMIAGVTFAFSTQVQAQSWTLTPQSNVGFEIKSLGVTVVRAKFNRVQSSMQFDAKAPQQASTNFVMDVNSLSLSKLSLKNMILGEDLFYASKYKSANFKSTSFKEIRKLILDKKKATPIDDLMYIIKSDSTSTFANSIDILDEMSISAVPPGHYAEVDITPTERMLIQKTEEANGIK